jgi:hypothetical protein
MNRPARLAILAALVLVLVAVGAGAALLFGHGGSTAVAQQAPAQQQQRQGGGPANSAAFQQFRQCMTQNGATLAPGQRPNMNDPAFQKARQACAQFAPQRPGGGGFGSPPSGTVAPAQSGATA